jgi:HD-GYP domain-containing protein (c-di-GMP phosphodiesterase class II)
LAKVETTEEIAVQRLPIYSRADCNYCHWAGKILVPRGQLITPDVVAALIDAEIDHLYSEGAAQVRTEKLHSLDIMAVPGDTPLPYSIFDREGRLLAGEGQRLSPEQMTGLHRRGQDKAYYYKSGPGGQPAHFEAAYVARVRERLDGEVVFSARREKTSRGMPLGRFVRVFSGRARALPVMQGFEKYYYRAISRLENMWQRIASGGYLRSTVLVPFVDELLERFIADREILAALALSPSELPIYPEHSFATAIYSLFAARHLQYSRAQARDLAFAALFHDIGFTLIPQKLLDAERALTKGERRILFRHVEHAIFLSGRLDWPGSDWLMAIYQHQERGTGAGYPSGYRAGHIHEYARILAAADVFHALASRRPHRKAHGASESLRMLMKMGAIGLLDARVVKSIARELSLYPIGATVSLSTGESARVIASTRDPSRPWVGVIHAASGQRIKTPKITDLSRFPGKSIVNELPPFEEPFAGF